jgi:predicted DNA-binding protein (MmcQ/YjbR family)
MNIEDYRNYCLSKKGVTEGFPFDKNTLVFKVMGKMFALADIDTFAFINLKCAPEKAIELREVYAAVKPGYHMNKVLWNSIYVNQDVSDKLIYQWIDDSYNLIVNSLTKKLQAELESL